MTSRRRSLIDGDEAQATAALAGAGMVDTYSLFRNKRAEEQAASRSTRAECDVASCTGTVDTYLNTLRIAGLTRGAAP